MRNTRRLMESVLNREVNVTSFPSQIDEMAYQYAINKFKDVILDTAVCFKAVYESKYPNPEVTCTGVTIKNTVWSLNDAPQGARPYKDALRIADEHDKRLPTTAECLDLLNNNYAFAADSKTVYFDCGVQFNIGMNTDDTVSYWIKSDGNSGLANTLQFSKSRNTVCINEVSKKTNCNIRLVDDV